MHFSVFIIIAAVLLVVIGMVLSFAAKRMNEDKTDPLQHLIGLPDKWFRWTNHRNLWR